MKKRWNKIKEKRRDNRIKKLEKRAFQYIQENAKLERQIESLTGKEFELSKQQDGSKTAEASLVLKDSKGNSAVKESKTYATDKTENDPKGRVVYNIRPDRLGPEDIQPSITMCKNAKTKGCYKCGLNGHIDHNFKTGKRNAKQKNNIAKRCNFCRKRGHIKRNCLARQRCWEWMEERSV